MGVGGKCRSSEKPESAGVQYTHTNIHTYIHIKVYPDVWAFSVYFKNTTMSTHHMYTGVQGVCTVYMPHVHRGTRGVYCVHATCTPGYMGCVHWGTRGVYCVHATCTPRYMGCVHRGTKGVYSQDVCQL